MTRLRDARRHPVNAGITMSGRDASSVPITLRNIRDVFFAMEMDEELFAARLADGTAFWDVVRWNVFGVLHTLFGGPYTAPPIAASPSLRGTLKAVAGSALNRLTRRYIAGRRPAYLFFTGQRIGPPGQLFDNIADHLVALVADRAVVVETMNRTAISFRRLTVGQPTRVPPPSGLAHSSGALALAASRQLSPILSRHFGREVDLSLYLREPLSTFCHYRDYYRTLFATHRPNAVVLINNGSYKGLFAAARDAGVPTIELQHGASCANNVFWSYPAMISADTPGLHLPTAYFTFSDYWRFNSHYPVKMSRAIGNDFFHQAPSVGDDALIVVISAYMFHDDLLPVTLSLAAAFASKTIFYKLHPHQFAQKDEIIDACSGRPNVRVISNEIDVPDLFRRCGFVIGIHSTLLYSALEAGKRVCIYERHNYFWHDDIFEYVERFGSDDELAAIVAAPERHFPRLSDRPSFFDPFDAARFRRALADVEVAGAHP